MNGATLPTNFHLTRTQADQAIMRINHEWETAANGDSLLETNGSIGYVLYKVTKALELVLGNVAQEVEQIEYRGRSVPALPSLINSKISVVNTATTLGRSLGELVIRNYKYGYYEKIFALLVVALIMAVGILFYLFSRMGQGDAKALANFPVAYVKFF